MDLQEIVEKYPNLEGIYIPEMGEIVHWGTGCAVVTSSPLDEGCPPLRVISLNLYPIFNPFEVQGSFLMGPYEAMDPEAQIRFVNDVVFGDRFRVACALFPEAERAWFEYCNRKGV